MPRKLPATSYFTLLLLAATCSSASAVETLLLQFTSNNCAPCRRMRPEIRKLTAAGFRVREINVSREPELADRFRVDSWPTFVALIDGHERARIVGFTRAQELAGMLRKTTAIAERQVAAQRSGPTVFGQSPDGAVLAAGDMRRESVAAPSTYARGPQAGPIVEIQPQGEPLPRRAAGNANKLIAATVRITVEDAAGQSTGAGTIVDSRSGEALILTCGHIFRESQGRGPITVTLFEAGSSGAVERTQVAGELIDFDLERDLGLVSIRPDVSIQPAPIAKADDSQPGTPVTTVGCNHGAPPTAVPTQVTAVNRYHGHPNIEAAGAPPEGRSGGGMFNTRGELIGVCYAADPQGDEGLYAALDSIHEKLNSQGLGVIVAQAHAAPQTEPSNAWPEAPAVTAVAEPSAIRGQGPTGAMPWSEPTEAAAPPAPAYASPPPAAQSPVKSLSAAEQAALEEIRSRGAESEVICIIRPTSLDGKSEVITLSNMSAEFVDALTRQQQATVRQ